jgi:hypothetical protein
MTLDELKTLGFQRQAAWARDKAGNTICRGDIPDTAGLYLFCVTSEIRYVGAALGSLRRRMRSYQRRQHNRSSTRPVHKKLAEAIERGEFVEVFTRAIDVQASTEYLGLPVSIILGAEAALIARINPERNRRGRAALLDSQAATADDNVDDSAWRTRAPKPSPRSKNMNHGCTRMNTDALRACEARVSAQTRIIGVHPCSSVVSNNLTVLNESPDALPHPDRLERNAQPFTAITRVGA